MTDYCYIYEIHKLSVAQLEVLQKEVIRSGQGIYQRKWAYRKQIKNAQTVEELKTIEFNFVMSDFSYGNNIT